MIQGKDTLPYKEKMVIANGDTTYEGACHTFEKINHQIVNQSDSLCKGQGLWIITDSLGNYWRGNLDNNHEIGIWQRFNKKGQLLKETEEVYDINKSYTVKEIDYLNGQPEVIINKPFFAFYIKNIFIIMFVIFSTFFSRAFINSRIYNVENDTQYSPIYFHFPGYVSENFYHSLICVFTLWFFKFKPENKRLVVISHMLSIISVGGFLLIVVGLGIGGEIAF